MATHPAAASGAFSAESIKQDLTVERPMWALTSYGPAKNEPNLISMIDLSQEELRWEYYQAVKANNPGLYRELST